MNMYLQCFSEYVIIAGGSSGVKRKVEDEKDDISSELLMIFIRNHKLSSITSISIPPIPNHNIGSVGLFSANYRGKLVVGNQNRLYQYKPSAKEWSELPSPYKNRHGASSCCIGSKKIIVCGGERHGDTAEIFHFDYFDRASIIQPASLAYWTKFQKNEAERLAIPSTIMDDDQSIPHWGCPSKLPIKVSYHTTMDLPDGRVMLIGGCRRDGQPSDKVFIGHLTVDETDVKWAEIGTLNHPRFKHIAFQLKGTIFVAGGIGRQGKRYIVCEKYDVHTNQWINTSYDMPYPSSGASAVVGKDQNYAIVIGGRITNENDRNISRVSSKVLVFTAENGFSEKNSFALLTKRHGHISLIAN